MFDRREFLRAAVAAVLPVGSGLAEPGATAADAALRNAFDVALDQLLAWSPELATSIGFDLGPRADARSRLDDRSLTAIATQRREDLETLKRWRLFNRAALSARAAIHYDTYLDILERRSAVYSRLGDISAYPYAYVVTQLDGAYQRIPSFLESAHPLASAEDADSYVERLSALAIVLDQESDRVRHDGALGVSLPDFILDLTIKQIEDLAGEPASQSSLVVPLARHRADKGIAGNQVERAEGLYVRRIQPALARQIETLRGLKRRPQTEAGLWALQGGEALYDALLGQSISGAQSAREVHEIGLDLVGRITDEIDRAMRAQGMTTGSVGMRLRAMFADERLRYLNSEEGRAAALAVANDSIRRLYDQLPRGFGQLPKARVTVRRVPPAIEAGSPFAYYDPPSFDASRPGIFWLNLMEMSERPRWSLPTITYHESIPGHHLQAALSSEAAGLPDLLKALVHLGELSAYMEGWAVYAEQLVDEWGVYADDPLGRIGYLHDALLRAARLVTDTGLHAMRWSRQQAVRYLGDLLGDPERRIESEVDRYCVWPGQACAYMIGKLAWLAQRERAQRALGPRFDIREFHDAGLLAGPVPLTLLERVTDDLIRSRAR